MTLHHAVTLTLFVGLSLAACDAKSGDAPAKSDAKTTDAPAKAESKSEQKPGDAKAEAKAEEAKAAAKAEAAEAKAEEAKPEAAKPAEAPPVAPPGPATAEAAARELGAWLSEPKKHPVPTLLSAPGDIEIAEYCGACDGVKKPKKSKVAGVDAMKKKAKSLREAADSGEITAEDKIVCKGGCCKFVFDPDLGVPDTVVNIEKICVALGEGDRPTAYTKIETTGSY